MVCLGNICRSPMAEGVMRKKIKEKGLDWEVDSAGTESFHVGEAPHRLSQKVARQGNVDISRQRARQFDPSDFREFDKIYAMAADVYQEMMEIGGSRSEESKVDLFLNELYPGEDRSVPDPWYGGEEGFQKAWRLIDATCDRIIEKYS